MHARTYYISYDMYAMGIAFKPRKVVLWFVVNRMAREQIPPLPEYFRSINAPQLYLSSGVGTQWYRLLQKYQATQFYRAVRIERKKERKKRRKEGRKEGCNKNQLATCELTTLILYFNTRYQIRDPSERRHFHCTLIRRTTGRSLGTFSKLCFFSLPSRPQ
jgi:hypothetical protein